MTLPSIANVMEIEQEVPSVNAFGYYSISAGHYLPFDEAAGEEKKRLDDYRILQYNHIFDKKERSRELFQNYIEPE